MTLSTRIDATPRLVDVAAGRAPADLVITDGRWVNVHSGEVIPNTDIAIVAGRFAFCGPDASHCIGPDTKVVEARGRYLVPGLCDAHMHVESGMITVTEFVRAVVRHGSTSLFIDPHEIANVLGLPGVKLMHDEAMAAPINVFTQMPSCVPSAPGLEIAGAEIGPDEVAEAMAWPGIVGLGEVMNFPGVANNDAKMVGEIAATHAAGKTVGGHFASPVLDNAFHAYVAGGPADDHEGVRLEDAIARVRQGMRAMMRLGSAWYDVESQITAVTEKGLPLEKSEVIMGEGPIQMTGEHEVVVQLHADVETTIIRNIDVMIEPATGQQSPLDRRDPERSLFALLTPGAFREQPHSRLYGWLMEEYRNRPDALARNLPHRDAQDWPSLSRRLGWMTFEDIANTVPGACPWL